MPQVCAGAVKVGGRTVAKVEDRLKEARHLGLDEEVIDLPGARNHGRWAGAVRALES